MTPPTPVVLSFDVEEHYRIEAAFGVECPLWLKRDYARRMEAATDRILDLLAAHRAPATFFVIGQVAESHPRLVRRIAAQGHEVASHGWDHQAVHRFTPETFREDLRRSKGALESVAGVEVVGYRAPTFSLRRTTAWAVDELVGAGFRYDSSIYPIRHDRYGVADAPRTPFTVAGPGHEILELPPVCYRAAGQNFPVGGGGYFRLFPLRFLYAGVDQLSRQGSPLAMLYFHPWEFDPTQPKLPLGTLSGFRTYVGVGKSAARMESLLEHYRGRFRRAVDVVSEMDAEGVTVPRFALTPSGAAV